MTDGPKSYAIRVRCNGARIQESRETHTTVHHPKYVEQQLICEFKGLPRFGIQDGQRREVR